MSEKIIENIVDEKSAGARLDVFLAECIEDSSRSFIQKAIKDQRVTINGQISKRSSRHVQLDDEVRIELPPQPTISLDPEDIPLEILHEDADLIVVDKPAGLVVHPAPGHPDGTLVNAVLYHCPDFQQPGEDPIRPGIVHRLDRDTSGVMVVAKSQAAFLHLARQASQHTFERCYLSLVRGEFPENRGKIDASLGRSITDRKKMAVNAVHSKHAVTYFESLERFGIASLVRLRLETGRTHQIRVHMRFAGRPVLGDPVYGVTDFSHWDVPPETKVIFSRLPGQALHAEMLGFEHPATGKTMRFQTPLPPRVPGRAQRAKRSVCPSPA